MHLREPESVCDNLTTKRGVPLAAARCAPLPWGGMRGQGAGKGLGDREPAAAGPLRGKGLALLCLALLCILLPAGAGAAPLLPIADEARIESTKSQTFRFAVPPEVVAGKVALSLLARLDSPSLAGSTYSMRLRLNDRPLEIDRLLNKARETEMLDGLALDWFGQSAFRVVYSPDYAAANREDHPACLVGGHAYDFVLDVAGILKAGENALVVSHSEALIKNALVLSAVGLVDAPPRVVVDDVGKPAPTGELPVVAPRPARPVKYTLEMLPHGGMAVRLGRARAVVKSSFSYPNVGWNTLGEAAAAGEEAAWQPKSQPSAGGAGVVEAAGKSYRLRRTLRPLSDHLAVSDHLTNLTGQDLHVSLRYSVVTSSLEKPVVTLRGNRLRILEGYDAGGDNPTALVQGGGEGFGLVAEDDVLRAQCSQVASAALGEAGLVDHLFMIPAGESYEVRWSLYPVPGGDYFDLVNAVRRNWGTNFTIPGSFAFAPHPTHEGDMPDLKAWLENGSLNCVSLQIPMPRPRVLSHGLAFLDEPDEQQRLKAQAVKLRALKPGLKVLQYLHVYITRSERATEEFRADRHLGPDGKQHAYPPGAWEPPFWLFLPTATNPYGKAMNRTFDLCLDQLGFDGIYWDELSHSSQPLAYDRRDGHSAMPDMATMTVSRPVANVALYTQDYQVQQAQRVLKAGKMLIGNGQPVTETMTRIHFPRFVEAWNPGNLRWAHLYCPLGLSSPDRVRTEDEIAANVRQHLERGGLWYYYVGWGRVQLTHPTITAHMFPFTPIELRAGTLIGKERILTSRSGLFGWGDKSRHRVYVYDDKGVLQPEFRAPARRIGGSTFTELRLPGGWLAAVERGE